jgi:hypothetical protein
MICMLWFPLRLLLSRCQGGGGGERGGAGLAEERVNWALPNDTQRGAPRYLAAPPLCMFMCRAFKRHGMVAMAGTQSAPTTTQQMRPNHCVVTSHSLSWTVRWHTSRHWRTGRRLTSSTPTTHSKSSAAGPRYVRWDRGVPAHGTEGGCWNADPGMTTVQQGLRLVGVNSQVAYKQALPCWATGASSALQTHSKFWTAGLSPWPKAH